MFLKNLFKKELKENYIYRNNDGKELIFLGKAVLFDSQMHSAGFVEISNYEKLIYIEKNVLENYKEETSLKEILEDLMKEYEGMSFDLTGLVYSTKPLRAKEIGPYPRYLKKENANMDTFHITFNLYEHIVNKFERRAV